MAGQGLKEESEVGEEDCWADAIDWEVFVAQEVLTCFQIARKLFISRIQTPDIGGSSWCGSGKEHKYTKTRQG